MRARLSFLLSFGGYPDLVTWGTSISLNLLTPVKFGDPPINFPRKFNCRYAIATKKRGARMLVILNPETCWFVLQHLPCFPAAMQSLQRCNCNQIEQCAHTCVVQFGQVLISSPTSPNYRRDAVAIRTSSARMLMFFNSETCWFVVEHLPWFPVAMQSLQTCNCNQNE